MNQKEMESEIWVLLGDIVTNLEDFDGRGYHRLRHGMETLWGMEVETTTTTHQQRFDRALNRVFEIIQEKVNK